MDLEKALARYQKREIRTLELSWKLNAIKCINDEEVYTPHGKEVWDRHGLLPRTTLIYRIRHKEKHVVRGSCFDIFVISYPLKYRRTTGGSYFRRDDLHHQELTILTHVNKQRKSTNWICSECSNLHKDIYMHCTSIFYSCRKCQGVNYLKCQLSKNDFEALVVKKWFIAQKLKMEMRYFARNLICDDEEIMQNLKF